MNKNHPMLMIMKNSLINLPTPSSISYLWNWGSMLGFIMVIQLISGILISSHYNPSVKEAFNSVIQTSRNTSYGWEMRFFHMNMASLFFICIFIHISRSIVNSSFKLKYTWMSGVLILMLLMATAFLGYVLPWGQMSFWGATVITNLLSAVPYIGKTLVEWLWGGFSIDNSTLNRFFSLHFMTPFILMMMIMIHLMSLHTSGSNKPSGVKPDSDKIPFHPFFSAKDITPIVVLMLAVMTMNSFFPLNLGDPENFNLANPLNTPIHIQPEWYFLFAYAILRSIPNKLGGVLALMLSIIMLVPMSMKKKYKTAKKWTPTLKNLFWTFSMMFFLLTWSGSKPVEKPYEEISKMFSVLYFMLMLSN